MEVYYVRQHTRQVIETNADICLHTVREVRTAPTYRRNTERMRNEKATLPGPEYAVALLEHLALEKRPLLTT